MTGELGASLIQATPLIIFRGSKIVSRIANIDSDRIVVLDKGRVAEFDTPAELIKRGGKFYELAKEAGLLDSDGSISQAL